MFMKNRTGAVLAALAVMAQAFCGLSANAETGTAEPEPASASYRAGSYEAYLDTYAAADRPELSIFVPVAEFTATGEGTRLEPALYGKENVLVTGGDGAVTWQFEVPEEGLYNLKVLYYPVEGKGAAIERSLLLDGELPYEEARNLTFHRIWKDAGDKRYDTEGNEYRRTQEEAPAWIETALVSATNYLDTPLYFYLSAGAHSLTLQAVNESMAIAALVFCQAEAPQSYEEVYAGWLAAGYREVPADTAPAKVQGEDAAHKSSASLYGISDRSSPADEPYSLTDTLLNTIGGTNWQYQGDWIEWTVHAEQEGLYKLAIRAKQDYKSGAFSTRSLWVNGEIPFAEVQGMRFHYNRNWQLLVPSDEEGNPYLFYLKKGENTIRLQVAVGDNSQVLRSISQSVSALSSAATKITMLTGSFPDPLRDYELKKTLPEVFETFEEQVQALTEAGDLLAAYSGGKGEQSVALDELLIQLERFLEDPRMIPSNLSGFKDNVSSLASWLLTASEQPLLVDYLTFLPPEAELPRADASFWQKLVCEVQSFFLSFISSYNNVADMGEASYPNGEVELWLAGNSGRDQATSIKSLADNYFSPQAGIRLNIRLVDMDVLLRAVSADEGPDVAIFQDQATPINYALRSALQDLSVFEDVEDVKQRFDESALIPLTLGDSLYGLPEQQTFLMMFYRKDILADLGVSVPETWEEFYTLIPILQNNNLKIGLPSPVATTSGGTATQLNALYNALLYQNDLDIFTPDGSRCLLDTPAAIEVFTQWTELYTKYKVDKTLNETDYFRTGEAPIVLSVYTLYNTLSVSAPEIKGLWGMAPVPGIRQEDGSIRRDTGSTVTSVIMFGNAEDKNASWEFMKWWTSAEAQILYGREIEALQGISARYPTANLEAMEQLPWPTDIAAALSDQWEYVRGVPEVAGGYYVGRNIDNAIKSVINENKNAREILLDYVEDINEEITVKRREFGLE